ncbi:MAG: hypothetical protein KGN76_02185 [Acidobacteriota bacterium]|nr:hypothetical protein [Acidobacteriota bacterium]
MQTFILCAWQLAWAAGLVENARVFAARPASTPAYAVIAGQTAVFFAFTACLATGLFVRAWRRRRLTPGAAGILLVAAAALVALQLEPQATHWLVLRYRAPASMDVWVDGQSVSGQAVPLTGAPPDTTIQLASAALQYDVVVVLDGWVPRDEAIRAAQSREPAADRAGARLDVLPLARRGRDLSSLLPDGARESATFVVGWHDTGYPLRPRPLLQVVGGGTRYVDVELRRARVAATMRGPEALVPIAHRTGLQSLAVGLVLGACLLLHGGLRRWWLAAIA